MGGHFKLISGAIWTHPLKWRWSWGWGVANKTWEFFKSFIHSSSTKMFIIVFWGELGIRFMSVSNHRKKTFESDVDNVLKKVVKPLQVWVKKRLLISIKSNVWFIKCFETLAVLWNIDCVLTSARPPHTHNLS